MNNQESNNVGRGGGSGGGLCLSEFLQGNVHCHKCTDHLSLFWHFTTVMLPCSPFQLWIHFLHFVAIFSYFVATFHCLSHFPTFLKKLFC